MQAHPKIYKILLVALIASLVLGGCGGGTTGATWFNLPSIPLNIQPDGTATVFGFGVPAVILQPAMIQQLQTANVQKLEVRLGYNGIHIYANGQDLPYIAWDATKMATLQEVIRKLPQLGANGPLIADWLPVTRQIGLGVDLRLPLAAGATALDIPRWQGETTVSAETAPATPTIGPFTIGSLSFDPEGNAKLGSVALSDLAPIKLDANTLGLLSSIGAEKLSVTTQPNGIDLAINDQPLPGIAYDTNSLNQALALATPLLPDPNLAATLGQVLPLLPGAALDLDVSFTGEPAGTTEIAAVNVAINEDGTLAVYGIPVSGNPIVPADILQKLQAANVQQLSLDIGQDGLFLATNGQTLPTITWTPETLNTLVNVVAPAAGIDPAMIATGLSLLQETGSIKANVSLPGAAADAAPVEINKTMTPPDLQGQAPPVILLSAVIQQGAVQTLGGLPAGVMPGLPISLPANVVAILSGLNADQLQIATDPNKLELLLDGNVALTLNYDLPSLQSALSLASPFLADTPLSDPAIATLLQEQILPQVPGSDVNVTVDLQ